MCDGRWKKNPPRVEANGRIEEISKCVLPQCVHGLCECAQAFEYAYGWVWMSTKRGAIARMYTTHDTKSQNEHLLVGVCCCASCDDARKHSVAHVHLTRTETAYHLQPSPRHCEPHANDRRQCVQVVKDVNDVHHRLSAQAVGEPVA